MQPIIANSSKPYKSEALQVVISILEIKDIHSSILLNLHDSNRITFHIHFYQNQNITDKNYSSTDNNCHSPCGKNSAQLFLLRSNEKTEWVICNKENANFQLDAINEGLQNHIDFNLNVSVRNNNLEIVHTNVGIRIKINEEQGNTHCVDLVSNKGEILGKMYMDIQTKNKFVRNSDETCPVAICSVKSDLVGQTTFNLTVNLKQAYNLSTQNKNDHNWISYEFLGAVVQSKKFHPSMLSLFQAKEDAFEIDIRESELVSFLKSNRIKIFLCREGEILGRAEVDLCEAFYFERESFREDHFAEGWIELYSGDNDDLPFAARTLCTDLSHDSPQLQLSLSWSSKKTSLQRSNNKKLYEDNHMTLKKLLDNFFTYDNPNLLSSHRCLDHMKTEGLIQKIKVIIAAEIDLGKKQAQWKDFKYKEELKFREHLRKKEEVVRNYLEEKMKIHESEQMVAIEKCRYEYKKLESRLKTALSDVESKEREMKRILAANNTTFVQKITELDLKEKLIREETQHIVDIERAKTGAMKDKMKVAESSLEIAINKARSAEEGMKHLQQKINNSNEAKITHELNMLKSQMEEIKQQLGKEITEKNKLISQRDEYRQAAQKLAKMVRREKEKNKKTNTQRFKGKEREELYRIQEELQALSFTEEKN